MFNFVLPSGRYLIRILDVEYSNNQAKYKYEIAVGPFAGYGAEKFKQAGGYPLYNSFPLPRAEKALFVFLIAANVIFPTSHPDLTDSAVIISLLKKAVGKLLWVTLESNRQYLSVRRHDPFAAIPIKPEDIQIGTSSWAAGSQDVNHAIALATYSGLPNLLVDVREKNSPMISWCAHHKVIPVPFYSNFGDYMVPGSDVTVDRKSGILELYSDFSKPTNFDSYCTAAQMAAALGKRLIYAVATEPNECVQSIDDLKKWRCTLPDQSKTPVNGNSMWRNITLYQKHFPNVSFVFVPAEQQCQKIYDLTKSGVADGT